MTEEQTQTALNRLRKAIIAQKTASLPDEPASPALAVVHEALFEYDRYVSEAVISVLQGEANVRPYPQIGAVETHIQAALDQVTPETRRAVEQYRKYKERLDGMHALVLEVVQEHGQ